MFRYSILWHSDIDEPHYDLMFETSPGSALATWRSPVWPITSPVSLKKLRDHRPAFLNFQGSLSGDRGTVTQIAVGMCEITIDEKLTWNISWPVDVGLRKLRLEFLQDDQWEAVAD